MPVGLGDLLDAHSPKSVSVPEWKTMKKTIILFYFLSGCTSIFRANEVSTLGLNEPVSVVHQSVNDRASYEAFGKNVAIATQGRYATEAARDILKKGGNLIDAAIAASFVISVERPHSTGIGGGGFMIIRDVERNQTYAVDFRERAPLASTRDMYLDSNGEVIAKKSVDGIFAVGVPGLVAGLFEIHKKLGRLPWRKLLDPAISLADRGFEVYPSLEKALQARKNVLQQNHDARRIFLRPDGGSLQIGDKLIQKDLARTLRLVARSGAKAFYKGKIANSIVKTSRKQGGILAEKDLDQYQVKWRTPVVGRYKGLEVLSMPPPSSGGTHVVQILNILDGDDLAKHGFANAKTIHLKAAAMQHAFFDRAQFLGDPDFNPGMPIAQLTSKNYANHIRSSIQTRHAKSADELPMSPRPELRHESNETTNFSMMDEKGNAVVSTQTINGWMGSGVVAEGTGILLNNEMDDFSAKPGASNLYGAIGSDANSVAPQKTPLSSMSPTLVLKGKVPIMAVGAPGGTRIITCVAQTIINYIDHHFSLYDSIDTVRFHHQWLPDQLTIESPGMGSKIQMDLESVGYKVKMDKVPCIVNGVVREGEKLNSVADPRDIGSAWAD